ncbi:MAG: glutathione S-transferase family protein [Proteobacteria bacterium]|nr:glutathione S-transferase family protein [Pseudomonadota bacterium]
MMKFYFHPLSSYCWKVLIALYEKGVAFEPIVVNLGDPAECASFTKLSPMRKMPAIVQGDEIVNESSIQIEWLDSLAGGAEFIPADSKQALEVRYWDRFLDLYVHNVMQRIVGERLRPADKRDAYGVSESKAQLRIALDVFEKHMAGRAFVCGGAFSLADCSAAPALFYANKVLPFETTHPHTFSYLRRLQQRASFARVLEEAKPYAHLFPSEQAA